VRLFNHYCSFIYSFIHSRTLWLKDVGRVGKIFNQRTMF